jgi:hypothetical protein
MWSRLLDFIVIGLKKFLLEPSDTEPGDKAASLRRVERLLKYTKVTHIFHLIRLAKDNEFRLMRQCWS